MIRSALQHEMCCCSPLVIEEEEEDYSHRLKIGQVSNARRQATRQVLTRSSSAVNYNQTYSYEQSYESFQVLFLQANDEFL